MTHTKFIDIHAVLKEALNGKGIYVDDDAVNDLLKQSAIHSIQNPSMRDDILKASGLSQKQSTDTMILNQILQRLAKIEEKQAQSQSTNMDFTDPEFIQRVQAMSDNIDSVLSRNTTQSKSRKPDIDQILSNAKHRQPKMKDEHNFLSAILEQLPEHIREGVKNGEFIIMEMPLHQYEDAMKQKAKPASSFEEQLKALLEEGEQISNMFKQHKPKSEYTTQKRHPENEIEHIMKVLAQQGIPRTPRDWEEKINQLNPNQKALESLIQEIKDKGLILDFGHASSIFR